jgi:hypothetical protein
MEEVPSMHTGRLTSLLVLILLLALGSTAAAQEKVTTDASLDLMSRYVWRGADIASTPSLQPTLVFNYYGFELGAWGAYTLSNNESASDEIDFWMGYSFTLAEKVHVTALVTDYYYPNAGVRFSNFNDYDDPDGAGAHLLEVGAVFGGGGRCPFTLSAYYNFYNEAGHNAYFQLDGSFQAGETSLDFFIGATPGSVDNPDYYGSTGFNVINLGVTAGKDIKVSSDFSLPLSVSFIMNPRTEVSYLVAGISL